MDAIDFYFFSGTGNTFLVVKKMREIFEINGVEVKLHKIEKNLKIIVRDILGIGFPVAIQGTYPFVWKFVKDLPRAKGTKVFIVDTLESFSGGVVGPMKKILLSKGYTPIGAREIKMPPNLLNKKANDPKTKVIISKGLKEAEEYSVQLLKGKAKWKRIPIISDLTSTLSRSSITWKLFRKILKIGVDENKCAKCGLCSQLCPTNNIYMQEYPTFGNECMLCMRCVSFCPNEAIHIKTFGRELKFERYKSVKANDLLKTYDDD